MFPLNPFTGCFYFAIGKYLANNTCPILDVLRKHSWLLFILFEVISIIELLCLYKFDIMDSSDISLFNLPAVFFLCVSVIDSNKKIKNAKWLRKFSTIIYCSQGNIIWLSDMIGKYGEVFNNSLINYIFCCLIELLIIFGVLYLEKKSKLVMT